LQGDEPDAVLRRLRIEITRHIGFLWLLARHIDWPAFLGIVCRGVGCTTFRCGQYMPYAIHQSNIKKYLTYLFVVISAREMSYSEK